MERAAEDYPVIPTSGPVWDTYLCLVNKMSWAIGTTLDVPYSKASKKAEPLRKDMRRICATIIAEGRYL